MRPNLAIIACLPAAVLLTACGVLAPTKNERPKPALRIPPQWSSVPGSAPVREGWLSDFSDPVVTRLVDEAVRRNFDLGAAAARMEAARARARVTGAAELPRLDAAAGAARRGAPLGRGLRSTDNTFDANVNATWEIDLWGRLARETGGAERDAAAAAADFRAARLSLAATVARAWFDTVEAALQQALAEETARNFRDNLAVVEEGFRAGLGSALDVRLERTNLASAESRVAARTADRDAAVRRLEVLLGRYPGAELAVTGDLTSLANDVPAGLPAELLVRRPDVRAAALRLAASDERLTAALTNRLPRIVLTGQGGFTSTELRDLLDPQALLWRIAGDLTAPLFRGGQLAAERDVARAARAEALAAYAQVVLAAFREVETALTAERLLAREQAALRVAAHEAREAEILALERYRSGLVDIVTWLEARRRAFDARSALLAVSNRRLQNRVALHLALGGDFGAAGAAKTAAAVTGTTGRSAL